MLYPCKSGWNLPTTSWDMVHTRTFWLKFGSLSPAVTLKIMPRSPKPHKLFIMSQCCIHANLVKIHQLVHEISCKQESVKPMPTLSRLDPHHKYVPLPFSGGHKYECFLMSGCWDIPHLRNFNINFEVIPWKRWNHERMNEKNMYRQMERRKLYTPRHKCQGHKKLFKHV